MIGSDLQPWVEEAGFDHFGVVDLSNIQDKRVQRWLARGYHGTMKWMERHGELRQAPSVTFRGFRTALVVTLEYGEVAPTPSDCRVGNISRYAMGDDYHRVFKGRLRRLMDLLQQEHPDWVMRPFVDTGPLNEKLAAQVAGLGWVGRHTNLIRQGMGSYFFLGLLLINAPIVPTDVAQPDRCGTCDACIPACPTGAIVAPYVLDARRCLSYLTIEHRGRFPTEFRGQLGTRIFGCDDCQEVCPWNRFARRDPPEEFRPRDHMRTRPLSEWLLLTREQWQETFRKSAVKRAKYEGFLRNVAVAIGSVKDQGSWPALEQTLSHPSGLVRAHVAWAMMQIDPLRARGVLREQLLTDDDPIVREELDELDVN